MLKSIVILSLITAFSLQDARSSHAPKVKVRIGNSLGQVTIKGLDINRKVVFRQDNKIEKNIKNYPGNQTLLFDCSKISNKIIREGKPKFLASINSPSGLLGWGENHYRGEIIVQTTPGVRGCDLVNIIDIEHYISSLLAKEVNSKWPIEALKAQAVAARSYALYKMNKTNKNGYHLINSERNQVNGTFFDETITTYKAARDTQGEVLYSPSGKLTPIFYHSKCSERTLTPEEVWGEKVEGYVSVRCPYGEGHGKKDWKYNIKNKDFLGMLPKLVIKSKDLNRKRINGKVKSIKIVSDTMSNSLLKLYVNDDLYMIRKSAFRKILGRERLPSNHFKVNVNLNHVAFLGKGNGHGVGMSQFGALELAKRGWKYQDILRYYFPRHKIGLIK